MSGWSDWIFGNLPPMPSRPASRGATFGANYQAMPDARRIEDRRQDTPGYSFWLRRSVGDAVANTYPSSFLEPPNPQVGAGRDPMLDAGPLVQGNIPDTASYKPSFQPNMRTQGPIPAPYRPTTVGPNLPPPPIAHLPITPGDPGWTPPPSPSGPHNPGGDPARPGFGLDALPTQFTSQQLSDALRAWGGWQ